MDAEDPPCFLLDVKDSVRISAWHTRGIEEAGLPLNSLAHVQSLGDVFLSYFSLAGGTHEHLPRNVSVSDLKIEDAIAPLAP